MKHREGTPARFGVGIRGRWSWQLVDRNGLVKQEGEQSNLILNQGLDLIADHGFLGVQDYYAVGTSSVAPDVTDTTLASELARTNSSGGVADVIEDRSTDGTIPAGTYRRTRTKEFDFAEANGNLTEWGSAASSTGDLFSRELFRDDVGDPVTITKTSAEKLRIAYTLEFTLTPITLTAQEAFSMSVTGLGTLTGTYGTLVKGEFTHEWTPMFIMDALVQAATAALYRFGQPPHTIFMGMSSTDYSGLLFDNTKETMDAETDLVYATYTAGDRQREVSAFWSTSEANQLWKSSSIVRRRGTSSRYLEGWVWTLDGASEFTKADTHQLTIEGPTVTWDRAGS